MLLDDDVMGHREAEPCSFPSRFGREEGIEHLFSHLGRDAGAVVANPDFDSVTEVLGRGGECWLVVALPTKDRWCKKKSTYLRVLTFRGF